MDGGDRGAAVEQDGVAALQGGLRGHGSDTRERRAQTVAQELKAAGVTDAQLAIVSYGKERPAVPGASEEAYAKNRRVEINQP